MFCTPVSGSLVMYCESVVNGEPRYINAPGAPARIFRPNCDAIEIAAAFGEVPPLLPKQAWVSLLQAAHVPTTLVMIQHDEHGLATVTPGQVEQPSPDVLIQMIQDFFVKTLAA